MAELDAALKSLDHGNNRIEFGEFVAWLRWF